jgi:hypothetical protein
MQFFCSKYFYVILRKSFDNINNNLRLKTTATQRKMSCYYTVSLNCFLVKQKAFQTQI